MQIDRNYFVDLDQTYQRELMRDPEIAGGDGWRPSVGVEHLGTGLNPFKHQTIALADRIREGLRKVEIVFMGQGKGSSQSFTPESFDRRDREEMRALAKINQVKTSTHASPNVMGLAGFTGEGFSPEQRNRAITEVLKAVDFAAEATTGGAVVVHTGEWQRPISEQYDGSRDGNVFRMHDEEAEKAPMLVVDAKTGRFTGIRKDMDIHVPEYKTVADLRREGVALGTRPDGSALRDADWVDADGRWIDPRDTDALLRRVPKWDEEKHEFRMHHMKWDDLEKDRRQWEELTGEKTTTAQHFIRQQYLNEAAQAEGQAARLSEGYGQRMKDLRKIDEALKYLREIDAGLGPDEKWKLEVPLPNKLEGLGLNLPPERTSKVAVLERERDRIMEDMRYMEQTSSSYKAQSKQLSQRAGHLVDAEEYGIKQTAKSLATLGMRAMEQTRTHRKDLQDDLYIAPENYDPSTYGSHPQELARIVEESRKE
ncbi:MAG: hypothetical protein HC945_03685, partial [Nitrosarchaeum sp.]|nr:hypothetical protein [Nitrosarchaeum sp.]